ncbi:MAG: diphosphomevalonate decarboxylase [Woeseiaceae bacterium]
MGAIARAQPNIALIKYWGKRDAGRNLPAVGSISITLEDLFTEMSVDLDDVTDHDRLSVNSEDRPDLLPRVSSCMDSVLGADRPRARVSSCSNFPLAAGLASSASSFAALVVAAVAAGGQSRTTAELASLAGRASGSAARSLYDGFVELRNDADGIVVESILDGDAWPLRVVAAITEPGVKPVGSGEAMEISRKSSPFYSRWVEEQPMDLATARDAIAIRDFGKLASIAEHNCLKMHSVMWASRPPVVYWNSSTLDCLQAVRELQSGGAAVFFTIDAGPQVKAVCLPEEEKRVVDVLSQVDGVHAVHTSAIGCGAALVSGE